MTAALTDLGPSWLSSVPDGATVLKRTVTEYRVASLGTAHFGARRAGRRNIEYFPVLLVADDDLPLLVRGARSWVVAERTGPGEAHSALRFQREKESAEAAFARDRKAGAR